MAGSTVRRCKIVNKTENRQNRSILAQLKVVRRTLSVWEVQWKDKLHYEQDGKVHRLSRGERFTVSGQFLVLLDKPLKCNRKHVKEGLKYYIAIAKTCEQQWLILQKGVYPYEYVDSFERKTIFPEKRKVSRHTHLLLTESTNEHKRFRKSSQAKLLEITKTSIWKRTKCFQQACSRNSEMFPCSRPSALFHSACFKLEWLVKKDIDTYLFLKRGMRGGISIVCKCYTKTNNEYLKDYQQPTSVHSISRRE